MPIGATLAPYLPLVEGQKVGGIIVDFRVQQRTDFDSKRPEYLEVDSEGRMKKSFAAYGADGRPNRPACDWIFTVDVGEEDENGDTERRIYLDPRKGKRGSAVEGKRGQDAVEIALKKAKAHRVGLEIGGSIFITRGPKVAPARGEAACITYTAEYQPPAGGPGTGDPVDETPWLVGGGRYDPNLVEPTPTFAAPQAGYGSTMTTTALGANSGAMISVVKDDGGEPPF